MATLPNHVATAFAQARQAAQVLTQQSASAEAVQVITDLLARCAGEPWHQHIHFADRVACFINPAAAARYAAATGAANAPAQATIASVLSTFRAPKLSLCLSSSEIGPVVAAPARNEWHCVGFAKLGPEALIYSSSAPSGGVDPVRLQNLTGQAVLNKGIRDRMSAGVRDGRVKLLEPTATHPEQTCVRDAVLFLIYQIEQVALQGGPALVTAPRAGERRVSIIR
jgi:hypothetical protein